MKHFLHRCDRAMIYIFIASSYFPWLTVGAVSCWMLRELRWAIWLLAVLGITYQQIFHERYKMLELLLYLVMGLGPAAIIVNSNVCPKELLSIIRFYFACQRRKVSIGNCLRQT
ncbi:Monocyte to macrophage differentiation factor 2 [Eumeta japonica]|uniref:Monocyte to macrophage differentiation factor 2 n=1 Tax=Eumeta variegata TaxID=151549 RepID=A0A4C1UVU1_EUMVA|nr:Monocyte to macrophage differentiation factor 2 [Eumeta japonica]